MFVLAWLPCDRPEMDKAAVQNLSRVEQETGLEIETGTETETVLEIETETETEPVLETETGTETEPVLETERKTEVALAHTTEKSCVWEHLLLGKCHARG